MRLRRVSFLLPVTVGMLALSEVEGAQSSDMRTRAEISNYEETSTYADVTRIIDGLVATSPLVYTESFGKTEEGRDLPLVEIAHPHLGPLKVDDERDAGGGLPRLRRSPRERVRREMGGVQPQRRCSRAHELADDHHVDSVAARRPQVRVEAELAADPEQPLLRAGLGGIRRVPLRPADGGEQHGVGRAARGERRVGQRGAVGVDRRPAEDVLLDLELADGAQDLERRGHDLGADPVAGQRDDPGRGHGGGA